MWQCRWRFGDESIRVGETLAIYVCIYSYSHVTPENCDSYHEGYYSAATVQCPRPNISIFDGSRIMYSIVSTRLCWRESFSAFPTVAGCVSTENIQNFSSINLECENYKLSYLSDRYKYEETKNKNIHSNTQRKENIIFDCDIF